MASICVVKRSRPNKNGLHPLQLRITMGKKTTRLNISQAIEEKYWDEKSGRVKKQHPNSIGLNRLVSEKLNQANKEMMLLEAVNPNFTLAMLKSRLTGRSSYQTFFSQADEFFETLQLAGKVNRAQGERPAIKHLSKFVGGQDLAFHDITVNLLYRYKAYLIGEIRVCERSAMNYLGTIRTIYNHGIRNGHAKREEYPFGQGKIKIKYPESLKIGLEVEEVEAIEELELPVGSYLDHARNMWLFSFYFAGMRVSDQLLLKWTDFNNGRLHYKMGKNNKPGSVRVPEKAHTILDYYKQEIDDSGLVFPDLKGIDNLHIRAKVKPILKNRNKKLNKYLKVIAELIDLNKPLTMHIARHTFGNIAGDKIPLQKLKDLYRHTSIQTTINYQKAFMNKGTDDALDAVVNFRSGNQVSEANTFYRKENAIASN